MPRRSCSAASTAVASAVESVRPISARGGTGVGILLSLRFLVLEKRYFSGYLCGRALVSPHVQTSFELTTPPYGPMVLPVGEGGSLALMMIGGAKVIFGGAVDANTIAPLRQFERSSCADPPGSSTLSRPLL